VRVKTEAKNVTMMRNDDIKETSPATSSNVAAFNVITGDDYHYIMKMSEYDESFTIGGVGITK